MRDTRFSGGVRCPRCGGVACLRWGSFQYRQRYRCRGCGRTFSDLTGTPAAYSKKLHLWSRYAACLAAGETVRRSALFVGIHPCTAFRWRHAILDGMRALDREVLLGWVELDSASFRYSLKGHRGALPPAPPTHLRSDFDVNVLLACDRRGHVVSAVTGPAYGRRLARDQIERGLAGRIEVPPVVLAAQGRLGPAAVVAESLGGRSIDARAGRGGRAGRLAHVSTVGQYRRRLLAWMPRFRGVATRYLPNYLIWHRNIDLGLRQGVAAAALRWPLAARGP